MATRCPLGFSGNRLSLLDRGVVMAYAHIRGGGELGDPGTTPARCSSSATPSPTSSPSVEHLTARATATPPASPSKAARAGGLLMGAVVNLRPDLFRAVLSHVPFVDVMNTMLDATLPLTVPEYEEWGNPNEPEDFTTC
jgi:oligopeptidase B